MKVAPRAWSSNRDADAAARGFIEGGPCEPPSVLVTMRRSCIAPGSTMGLSSVPCCVRGGGEYESAGGSSTELSAESDQGSPPPLAWSSSIWCSISSRSSSPSVSLGLSLGLDGMGGGTWP